MRNTPVSGGPAGPRIPARDRVRAFVRDGIMSGAFAAGTFLEEEQISAATGVSRTPVREAFQQLHSQRLIDLLPRRGAMVRAVTVQELVEVCETRLMVEAHVARKLCSGRQPVPPVMLSALTAMQGDPQGSLTAHVGLNTAFHQGLVAASGNEVIISLYDALSTRQERVAMTAVTISPGHRKLILDEHERLVAALAAHDAEAAVAVLAVHLRPVREILSQLPDAGAE